MPRATLKGVGVCLTAAACVSFGQVTPRTKEVTLLDVNEMTDTGTGQTGPTGASDTTVTVGGTVSGLAGSGLTLTLTPSDQTLPIMMNGAFVFPTAIAIGAKFTVAVSAQPTGLSQYCSVTGSTGTAGVNVTSVSVTCATRVFTIGGTAASVLGSGLQLTLNGGSAIPVTNGTFTFTTPLLDGTGYTVAVGTPPMSPQQDCIITGGIGTLMGANVTTIAVDCGGPVGVCRPAAGPCDAAESYAGGVCPADAKLSGTECRAAGCPGDPPEVCDGASNSCPAPSGVLHQTQFVGGSTFGTLAFSGKNSHTRSLALPTNAQVSAATVRLVGVSKSPPYAPTPQLTNYALANPDRATGLFYRRSEEGVRFFHTRFDTAPAQEVSWAGVRGPDGVSGCTGLGYTLGLAGDETNFFRVTNNVASTDMNIVRGDTLGGSCATIRDTLTNIDDTPKLSDTTGIFGLAATTGSLYFIGGSAGGLGYLERWNKLATPTLAASTTLAGAELLSGLTYAETGPVPITPSGTVDCSAGCLFANRYKESAPTSTNDVVIIDPISHASLGEMNFTNNVIRHAGIMVSRTAPNGDVGDAVVWIGYFASATIDIYAYFPRYPRNVTIDVGTIDSAPEYSIAQLLNTPQQTATLTAPISAAIAGGCTCSGCALTVNGCEVPVVFAAGTVGSITYSQLDVTYTCGP